MTGESRNLIQISAHASKQATRLAIAMDGSKRKLLSKGGIGSGMPCCLCMLLGRTDAETGHQCSDSATTSPRPHHGHGHTRAYSFIFSLPIHVFTSGFFLLSLPVPDRSSRVVSRGREIQHVLQVFLLQSQPVGRLSVYLSSMDHVTSNDKRGRVQVKRLVDFYSFSIYRSQSSPHLCCAHIRFMKSATSGRHQNQGKPCLFHGTGQSK